MVKKTEHKPKTIKHAKKTVTHKATVKHEEKVQQEKSVKKLDKNLGYIFAVGRRKSAIARVRLFDGGKGDVVVNNKTMAQYFPSFEYQLLVLSPLKAVGMADKFNLSVRVLGGGKNGQAEATRLGVARALIIHNPDWRATLKPFGYLTRDARVKERKKPGLKKARRAPQWQKR
jgi:small subunit ribosomal protein S9